ncbi:MAG: rhodanese-like domain-containing protein [Candidatus Methanoperedens sp.]|nr:rhodanese-like domain-containing protein [Candidatus Methanoperedens sp.]
MKKIYSAILAYIILVAMVSGCISGTPPTEKASYVDVSVQQGKEMIDRGEVFILDVRTQEEYDEDHIMGSTLIPVEELDIGFKELPHDKKILVYCRSGRRSVAASEILVKNEFTQIYNMKGGITEWKNAGYEVVK